MEYIYNKHSCTAKIEHASHLKERERLKRILQSEYVGNFPQRPDHLRVKRLSEDRGFAAGKATLSQMCAILTVADEEFEIHFNSIIPTAKRKLPAFVVISESAEIPNAYLPAEEIIDCGFAVFSFCAYSVTDKDSDFKKNIGKIFPTRRNASSPGKLAIWAWAASRIMDCIKIEPIIDGDNIAVIGHGHLGAATLIAGAFDERFKFVIANGSGYFGAALLCREGEDMRAPLANGYSHLFAPAFSKNSARTSSKYDNHILLSLVMPRHLIIGEALGDFTVAPKREYEALLLAHKLFLGEDIPKACDIPEYSGQSGVTKIGNSLFYLRDGSKYLSRHDWRVFIEYIKKIMESDK